MDKVALGQIFLRVFFGFPLSVFHSGSLTLLCHLWDIIIGPLVTTVQTPSNPVDMNNNRLLVLAFVNFV
jgi:hypothetical protein